MAKNAIPKPCKVVYEIGKTHASSLSRLVQGDYEVALGKNRGRASAPRGLFGCAANLVLIRTALADAFCPRKCKERDFADPCAAAFWSGPVLGRRRIGCGIAAVRSLSRRHTKRPLPRRSGRHRVRALTVAARAAFAQANWSETPCLSCLRRVEALRARIGSMRRIPTLLSIGRRRSL